jgi:hypothetical protein
MEIFIALSHIHDIKTWHNQDLFQPQSNLLLYQKGPYYSGVKLFNGLPLSIKQLAHSSRQFQTALSTFLHSKSFYTVEEYFSYE